MSEETNTIDWREELMSEYGGLFRDRSEPMSQTCMCWGLSVGDGWKGLLEKLCKRLAGIEKLTGVEIRATQVKEKYGTLRFYFYIRPGTEKVPEDSASLAHDLADAVVALAEHDSGYTCERCGERGSLRTGDWWVTLCDECNEKQKAER